MSHPNSRTGSQRLFKYLDALYLRSFLVKEPKYHQFCKMFSHSKIIFEIYLLLLLVVMLVVVVTILVVRVSMGAQRARVHL